MTGGHDGAAGSSSTSVNGQYTGQSTKLTGSLSNGDGYKSASVGSGGSIVAHPAGVTCTPYSSDTMAVIRAPGAEDAKVRGYAGLKRDSHGNAVVPYLRPYEMNDVGIDPQGTAISVELDETSQQVALKYGVKSGDGVFVGVAHQGWASSMRESKETLAAC